MQNVKSNSICMWNHSIQIYIGNGNVTIKDQGETKKQDIGKIYSTN